jgi:hypothetical protein
MTHRGQQQLSQSLVQLDRDAERVVERGREAWASLRADETFEKWIAIGRAIEVGRSETMRALHTNRPAGAQWSRVFGAWLAEQGFAEIDKGVRSRLQDCLDHLPEIEAWRQNIGLAQRLQLNHPNSVWRKWQAAARQPAPAPGSGPAPALAAGNRKDAEIMRLQEELDAAQHEIARLRRSGETVSEGRDWSWQDRPEDIAAAMLRLYPDKAKRLGSALQNLAKATQPAATRRARAKA